MTKQEKEQAKSVAVQNEEFRLKVVENELIARFNKAEFEKMHYYLEAKKISDEFLEVAKKDEEERKQMEEEFWKQIGSQVKDQNEAVATDEVEGAKVVSM